MRFGVLIVLLAQSAATEESCSKPILRYFDIRGRGEVIRIALHDLGVAFSDESFTNDEWGRERPDGLKAKLTSEGKLSFGQVPLLEVDGLNLVQSHTILRYLGRKYGWYNGAPAELAQIDLMADGIEDVRKRLAAIKYSEKSDDEIKSMYANYFTNPLEAKLWLGFYEGFLQKSQTGFVASTPVPTHADYLLLDLLDFHISCSGEEAAALLNTMPALSAFRSMMWERPNLINYLQSPGRRAS